VKPARSDLRVLRQFSGGYRNNARAGPLTVRVRWPRPLQLSLKNISPMPQLRFAPSDVSDSISPDNTTIKLARALVCQSHIIPSGSFIIIEPTVGNISERLSTIPDGVVAEASTRISISSKREPPPLSRSNARSSSDAPSIGSEEACRLLRVVPASIVAGRRGGAYRLRVRSGSVRLCDGA
jgi:hypothetical protein